MLSGENGGCSDPGLQNSFSPSGEVATVLLFMVKITISQSGDNSYGP